MTLHRLSGFYYITILSALPIMSEWIGCVNRY